MSLRITQVSVVFFLGEVKNFEDKKKVKETVKDSGPLQTDAEDNGNICRRKT